MDGRGKGKPWCRSGRTAPAALSGLEKDATLDSVDVADLDVDLLTHGKEFWRRDVIPGR
jgi:hypothetical protein